MGPGAVCGDHHAHATIAARRIGTRNPSQSTNRRGDGPTLDHGAMFRTVSVAMIPPGPPARVGHGGYSSQSTWTDKAGPGQLCRAIRLIPGYIRIFDLWGRCHGNRFAGRGESPFNVLRASALAFCEMSKAVGLNDFGGPGSSHATLVLRIPCTSLTNRPRPGAAGCLGLGPLGRVHGLFIDPSSSAANDPGSAISIIIARSWRTAGVAVSQRPVTP